MCIRDRDTRDEKYLCIYPGRTIAFRIEIPGKGRSIWNNRCLLYTSDAADDLLCVDLGGRRIIKKKKQLMTRHSSTTRY